MSTAITLKLGASSIQSAIDALERYARSLEEKAAEIRRRIAEVIRWNAQEGFSIAITTDIFVGPEAPPPDVTVTVEEDGDVSLVIAQGEDAVFIEFGAGVYYNGSAGTSPHPAGQANGFLIGEYGLGHGKRNMWFLPGSTKEQPIITHGTPAMMPMYYGLEDALRVITDIAREVFST